MKNALRIALVTLVFWALIILGPTLIYLWNALSPAYGQYQAGSLGYAVLMIIAQPISCGIAFYAANHVSADQHDICVFVNLIIAAVVMVVFFFFSGNISEYIKYAISVIVCVVCSYFQSKNIRNASGSK